MDRHFPRSGDAGLTSLADGTRVSKDSARVEAYGAVDELDSLLGLARVEILDSVPPSADRDLIIGALETMQDAAWQIGASLAMPGSAADGDFEAALSEIERINGSIELAAGPISCFVIPGASRAEAVLHVARTVCRRTERQVVSFSCAGGVDSPGPETAVLNRMSSVLFAAARLVLKCQGISGRFRGKS